ncbi:MAG: regulatory protein RecX [Gammaproteobacteria bacterium]
MKEESPKEIRHVALDLLARREHSRLELKQKFLLRDFSEEEIENILEILAKENLQSDERFAENYIRSRVSRGFGPIYIKNDLRYRGVSAEIIKESLEAQNIDWPALAKAVWQKKYGRSASKNPQDKIKQMNFLRQRGFGGEQIRNIFSTDIDSLNPQRL